MNRRAFILAVPVMLTDCATLSSNVSKAAEDVGLIASSFQNALGNLASLNVVDASTAAQVAQWLAQLQTAAASVKADVTMSSVQGDVQQVETIVNSIVTALAKFPLPPPIPTIFLAASVLLPVIEAAVGLVVVSRVRPRAMTPDQARMTLRAYGR